MASKLLSKSKYLAGLRCPLLLWTLANDPASLPPVSVATQQRFDEGHKVGHFAKKLFPNGIDVPTGNFIGNVRQTEKLIRVRKPVFEAGVLQGRLYSRADILNPADANTWDIYEVKSSTNVKEINIHDVAFQKHVYQQAGIKISRCFLIHIDNNYVKYGEVDPEGLFTVEDISGAVEDATIGIEERINNMFATMGSKSPPEQAMGSYCLSPWECDLKATCWKTLPENHIFELTGGKAKQFLFFEQGITKIQDIPDDAELTRKQIIQKKCVSSGTIHVEKEEICHFVEKIEYPRYYLEIKTANSAIPVYDGTRPYQHVPVQFSLHVMEKPSTLPAHHSFLAHDAGDHRIQFAEKLSQLLGQHGSVIVCGSKSKESILQELSSTFPRYKNWAKRITARMVDLLWPFSNFHYYHPSQKDGDSLDRALLAVTCPECESSTVTEENPATIDFMRTLNTNATADEITAIRQNLLDRSEQETLAMIEIGNRLAEICAGD